MILLVATIGVFLLVLYKYITWNNGYWKKQNIPHIPPEPIFGNARGGLLMTKPFSEIHSEIYKKFRDYKYCGYFSLRQPELFIIDVDLLKDLLIRDIQYFNDNGFQTNEKNDPYTTKNPFFLTGERWKLVRSQLSPAFSSGRIRHMFPQMLQSSKRLVDYIRTDQEIVEKNCVDAKELSGKYTIDVVASATLSLDVKTFENPNAEFRKKALEIFESDSIYGQLKFMMFFMLPSLANILGIGFITREIGIFFRRIINEQITYRKDNKVVFNDFLDFMQDLKQKCVEYDFDDIHMASHIISFFTDGFETSAITMSFVLYELAINPEIQTNLRKEVDAAYDKGNGELTYDALTEMKYLDSIITETLRLHPVVASLRKRCVTPYDFPPCKDDGNHSKFTIPKAMYINIPISCIMRDPEYFPNPDEFDPDRFSEPNKANIKTGTFLAFGNGPRQCIGMRFATSQIKVGLSAIIRSFEIRLNEKTKTPIQEDPSSFLLKPLGGMWVKFYKRIDNKM